MTSLFGYTNEKKAEKAPVETVQPRAHKYGPPRQPKIFQTIPEIEIQDETGTISTISRNVNEQHRVSFAKRERKASEISAGSTRRGQIGNGDLEGNDYQLRRGVANNSVRSSAHGSVNSLPVIREQYCCCTRWTRLEKNLVTAVAVLAVVIIGLVIAVGVLAGNDGVKQDFHWKI